MGTRGGELRRGEKEAREKESRGPWALDSQGQGHHHQTRDRKGRETFGSSERGGGGEGSDITGLGKGLDRCRQRTAEKKRESVQGSNMKGKKEGRIAWRV